MPCGPLGYAGGTNLLYRNRGDGTFEDVSRRPASRARAVRRRWCSSAQLAADGSYGMGAAAADFDNDGWPDIYVACDTAPSLLYRNNHDGTFREVGVPAGCAFDEHGVALAGHGRRRRRLRRRRLARHRPHELLRSRSPRSTGTTAAVRSRSRASGPASASTGSTSASASTSSTSTTTAGRTSSSPTATCIRSWTSASCTSPTGSRTLLYRNLGNGRFVDVLAAKAAGDHVAESRTRLRVRRFRQRRRRRHRRQQPRTARRRCCATTAAAGKLDPDQVRRHAIEPFGDRRPGEGHLGRTRRARSTR